MGVRDTKIAETYPFKRQISSYCADNFSMKFLNAISQQFLNEIVAPFNPRLSEYISFSNIVIVCLCVKLSSRYVWSLQRGWFLVLPEHLLAISRSEILFSVSALFSNAMEF